MSAPLRAPARASVACATRARWAAGLALLLCAAAVPARAQPPVPPDTLAAGVRVRVDFTREVPGHRWPILRETRQVGTLVAFDSTGVVIRPAGAVDLPVPLVRIEQIGVSLGRSPGRGAMTGLAWGTLAGLGLALVIDASGDQNREGGVLDAPGFAVVAGLGAAVGTTVGYQFGGERWRPVPVRRLWQDAGR